MKANGTLKKYIPYALVLAAGTLWGCNGFFNRRLSALGLSSADLVLVRNAGTLVLLTAVFALWDRRVFKIEPRHLPYFAGTGVVSVFFFTLCYFRCQQLSSLAVAAILLYTAPAFVVLLSALVFRDPITRKKLLALLVAFCGCVLVSGVPGGKLTPAGLLLGLGSGLFYGMYSIFARMALRYYKPLTVTYYTFAFAAAGSLVLLAAGGNSFEGVRVTWGLAGLVLGVLTLTTVAPYLLYTKGLGDLGDSGKASILASIEPVVASLVGVIAFGEPLGPGTVGGLACILLSVFILR